MAAILKVRRRIWTSTLSIDAYIFLEEHYILAKFHPDLIWNAESFGFFEDSRPDKKNNNNNKMSSDMGCGLVVLEVAVR